MKKSNWTTITISYHFRIKYKNFLKSGLHMWSATRLNLAALPAKMRDSVAVFWVQGVKGSERCLLFGKPSVSIRPGSNLSRRRASLRNMNSRINNTHRAPQLLRQDSCWEGRLGTCCFFLYWLADPPPALLNVRRKWSSQVNGISSSQHQPMSTWQEASENWVQSRKDEKLFKLKHKRIAKFSYTQHYCYINFGVVSADTSTCVDMIPATCTVQSNLNLLMSGLHTRMCMCHARRGDTDIRWRWMQ